MLMEGEINYSATKSASANNMCYQKLSVLYLLKVVAI